MPEKDIRSSGFVIDTLEAAFWCFLTTDNYKDAVLKAVNLGDDTDTTGAVTGALAGLAYGLESIPQVERVRYSEVAATTLTGVNALVAYTSVGIIAILLAVSVFLINNTVMIGISVRKSEIEIMKYIGATDFFVRSPFVIEGILIGLIGSLLPLGLIYVLYKKVIDYVMIEFPSLSGLMQFLPVSEIYRTLLPVCLGLGAGIGFLGSFITVRKHLRV